MLLAALFGIAAGGGLRSGAADIKDKITEAVAEAEIDTDGADHAEGQFLKLDNLDMSKYQAGYDEKTLVFGKDPASGDLSNWAGNENKYNLTKHHPKVSQ